MRVQGRCAQHEVGAGRAHLGAIEHELEVLRLDVPAAGFQAVGGEHAQADGVTALAIFQALFHGLFVHKSEMEIGSLLDGENAISPPTSMRPLPLLFASAALFGLCLPGANAPARADWQVASSEAGPASVATPAPLRHRVQTVRDDAAGKRATLHFVLLEPGKTEFKIVDQGAGGRLDLGAAMRGAGCLAGVNGGYFHPDFQPLGLVVSDGRVVHAVERAALLSGVLLVGSDGRSALLRAEEYLARAAKEKAPPRQALQAGPFLVDKGAPVAGLNATRAARRTAVLTDGAGRWALVSTSALTLAETGALLARPGVAPDGFRVRRALNLDGGSSTGLWVRAEPEPFYQREFSTVRNFLGVVPR